MNKNFWTPELDKYIVDNIGVPVTIIASRLSRACDQLISHKDVLTRYHEMGYSTSRTACIARLTSEIVVTLKIDGKCRKFYCTWGEINIGELKLFIVVSIHSPRYVVWEENLIEAKLTMRKRLAKHFNMRKIRCREIDWDMVHEMRDLWTAELITFKQGMRRYGSRFREIIANKHKKWYDPNYSPPQRACIEVKHLKATIYGETKTLSEWSKDPRCNSSLRTIYNRYTVKGFRDERLIKNQDRFSAVKTMLTLNGETKSLTDWASDERCKVTYELLIVRYHNGERTPHILRGKYQSKKLYKF